MTGENKSASLIRNVVIPVTWVAAVCIGIYIFLSQVMLQKSGGGAANWLILIFDMVACLHGAFFATVVWLVLADWIDNLSVIANNTDKIVNQLSETSSEVYERDAEKLRKRRDELVNKIYADLLTYEEKKAALNEIKKIDMFLNRQQKKD